MTRRRQAFRLISMLVLFIGGCVGLNETPTQLNVATPIHPTESMLTPAITLTSSQIPTAIPTLSKGDARLRIQSLLSSNDDCRLPCLWGFTPGKTPFQEALTALFPLGSISDWADLNSESPSYISFLYDENDLQIAISIAFVTYPDNNIISYVNFKSRALKRTGDGFVDVFDSSSFSEQVDYYLLANVLSEYGRPESVRLSTAAKLPSRGAAEGGFELLLLYPDQGLFARYKTQMQVVGTSVRGCLSNAHVEFDLYPSGQRDSFFRALDSTFWPQYAPNRYRLLEEVTSMSLDEFYQTFRKPTNKCLETPASLWPVPE